MSEEQAEAVQPLDVQGWVQRWADNEEKSESISVSVYAQMDCQAAAYKLLLELVKQLQFVPCIPADLFDRPHLFAVLAAVHEVFGGVK